MGPEVSNLGIQDDSRQPLCSNWRPSEPAVATDDGRGHQLIVSPAILPTRDIAVHEAGHFVVGQSFGIPCQPPVISGDRRSGFVQPDLQPLPPGTNKASFLAQFDSQQVRKAAMARAVFCLAGFAAESRLSHSHWAAHRIIGGDCGFRWSPI